MPIRYCKKECYKFKRESPKIGYTNGMKYCCKCKVFFVTDKIYCPCCGIQLRYNKHNGRSVCRIRKSDNQKLRDLAIHREHNKILQEIILRCR